MTPAQAATAECLSIMAEAKRTLVALDGIGAELFPALLAWDEHSAPIGYCMVQNQHVTPVHLHRTLSMAAGLMVTGWHASALAITTESYVEPTTMFDPTIATIDPIEPTNTHISSAHPSMQGRTPEEDTRSLAERYPTDPTVHEALWVAYTDTDEDHCMGIMTMHQGLGRTVTFDDPTFSDPDQHEDFDTPGTLQHILAAALALPRLALPRLASPPDVILADARRRIAAELHKLGLTVYLDEDPMWNTRTL